MSNYDCLYGGKGWNKLGDNPGGLVRDFWKYSHPYQQIHLKQCNRFYCEDCLCQKEESQRRPKKTIQVFLGRKDER